MIPQINLANDGKIQQNIKLWISSKTVLLTINNHNRNSLDVVQA
jgi:hypothetical protein